MFRTRYQIAEWSSWKLVGFIPRRSQVRILLPLPSWVGDVRVPDRDKVVFWFCLDKIRRASVAGRLAESIRTVISIFRFGGMAELANASALKAEVPKGHGGSKPSPSANLIFKGAYSEFMQRIFNSKTQTRLVIFATESNSWLAPTDLILQYI